MTPEAGMAEPALTPGAPAIWTCPCCHGLGDGADGTVEFRLRGGQYVTTVCRPGTRCWVCRGKGRVLVSPLPEDMP